MSRPPAGRTGSRADFVLVDFDGTLAAADVGNRFFRHFARAHPRWNGLIDDWMAGRITARECLARECELASAGAEEALAFVDDFALAEDAPAFLAAARAAGHEVLVASDGLGFYIERLLARAGLDVPFVANRLLFEAGGLMPVFSSAGPEVAMAGGRTAVSAAGAAPGCGRCGNCKGALLRAARVSGRYRRLVAVGDGYSDRCVIGEADVLYAKDDLLAFCLARGVPAVPFAKLADVVAAEGWSAEAGAG